MGVGVGEALESGSEGTQIHTFLTLLPPKPRTTLGRGHQGLSSLERGGGDKVITATGLTILKLSPCGGF